MLKYRCVHVSAVCFLPFVRMRPTHEAMLTMSHDRRVMEDPELGRKLAGTLGSGVCGWLLPSSLAHCCSSCECFWH